MTPRPSPLTTLLLAWLLFGAGATPPVEARDPESGAGTGRLEVRLAVDGAPGSGWRCVLLGWRRTAASRFPSKWGREPSS